LEDPLFSGNVFALPYIFLDLVNSILCRNLGYDQTWNFCLHHDQALCLR